MSKALTVSPKQQKEKLTPEKEYPKIAWSKTSDPDIQKCIVLYKDRTICYYKMKEIDKELDSDPPLDKLREFINLDNQNLRAFDELRSFNETGKFLYKHILLKNDKEIIEFIELKKNNPVKFMNEISNVEANIKRYKSWLNNKRKGCQNTQNLLEKAQNRQILLLKALNL